MARQCGYSEKSESGPSLFKRILLHGRQTDKKLEIKKKSGKITFKTDGLVMLNY